MRCFDRRHPLVLVAAIAGCAALSACSSSSSTGAAATPTTSPAAAVVPRDPDAVGLVGAGCQSYLAATPTGPGSVDAMAQTPLATAASGSPMLKELSAAISGKLNKKVNLVDTLNGGQFTVFAPVDSAFAQLPAATVAKLKTSAPLLVQLLTYHVVAGQLSPDKVAGSHTTVEGVPLTVTGSGNSLKVNGASVVCGGLHTANATVYLINRVLAPPAGKTQ